MQKRLRPALKPYTNLYLIPAVILIIIAILSWFLYGDGGLFVIAVSCVLTIFFVAKFLDYAYQHYFTEYTIDDSEITVIYGLWAKDENHVPINKIEDYKVDRSILSKILGLANIGVQTARGEKGFEVTLYSIPEDVVMELDKFLDSMIKIDKK